MERIIVNEVSKEFKIGVKTENALSRFIMLFSGNEPKKTIQVLNKVSFKVNEKEILGIIGENGSGKSTMLRILAGIYKQDSGNLVTNGKIISLINLNVGLKDRLTMKDNIYLVGSFFELTKKQIKSIFNDIVKFSELENFVNTKIYQFSEGMKQRLAFSIAVHSDPEILLLDEVLSVGDEQFKAKSLDKIKELIKNGACGVFVSHDLESIRNHCRKTLLLHKGELVMQGNSKKVVEEYLKDRK